MGVKRGGANNNANTIDANGDANTSSDANTNATVGCPYAAGDAFRHPTIVRYWGSGMLR